MSAIIKVDDLNKQYQIGTQAGSYGTLRESLSGVLRFPFRRSKGEKNGRGAGETFWALKGISFEVRTGEVLGIVGRNGAGKSTLLKILSRITEPTSGRVELYGRVGSLLEVGTGFHPELTGRENVYLNGAILGMKRNEIDRKFDEIVAFAEIEKFLDTPVKRYSSGMYVRLAFAVAAHLESEILIVDEVLAVGDAGFQKKCLDKMEKMMKGGRTVLIVSHSAGLISSLCTRVIYLAGGSIRSEGKPDHVIKEYFSEVREGNVQGLDRLRLAGMGARIRFLDITLGRAGQDSNVEFGEPLEFFLTIESEENCDGLSIGSSIFNVLGNCVGSLITRDEFSIKAGERLRLRLNVSNLNLAPGSYSSGFSIGSGGFVTTRADFDALIGTPSFQVLPISSDKEYLTNWHVAWGSIVFKDARLMLEEYREV